MQRQTRSLLSYIRRKHVEGYPFQQNVMRSNVAAAAQPRSGRGTVAGAFNSKAAAPIGANRQSRTSNERGPMTHRRKFSLVLIALSATLLAFPAVAPTRAAQAPRPTVPFLADHYDVSATLDPYSQSISAVAKVEFKVQEVSSTIRVELHQNLGISEVKSADGKTLNFQRDNQSPLNVLVNLPAPLAV